MEITIEELRIIALNVVSANQRNFHTDDSNNDMTYTLAYNDGVLDLLNAIIEKKGETV